jgi:hypothetical protein
MLKAFLGLSLAAFLTPTIAQAQPNSAAKISANSAITSPLADIPSPPSGDPKTNLMLAESLNGIPAPTGDPATNKSLKEFMFGNMIAAPAAIGNGTINSSNILFTTPNPARSGPF